MLIVDAQVHIWEKVASESSAPRPEPFRAEELIGLMNEAGVDRVVLAPTSWAADGEDGNDLVTAAVKDYPDLFRAFGVLDLADSRSRDRVLMWRARGLAGFCLRFHHKHLAPQMTDGTADWIWPAAEEAGVPLTLNVPHHLPKVAEIARDHPQLRMAIDHLAVGPRHLTEAVDELLDLARCDNVCVKADGVIEHSTEPFPHADVQPQICRVVEAFGPRRVFWGTDLTRMWRPGASLAESYRRYVELFTEHLPCLSGEDLELVMGRALCEWIGWP